MSGRFSRIFLPWTHVDSPRMLSFVSKIVEYARRLLGKWIEMVTGGLIAVYLAVQPYTHLAAPPKRLFWGALAAAWAVASFRVWNETYAQAEALRLQRARDLAAVEDPDLLLTASWVGTEPLSRPMKLIVRNQGRTPISSFQLSPLRIGINTIDFEAITNLESDIDRQVVYRVVGATPGEPIDLLDLLMLNRVNEIAPLEYQLSAQTKKQNGQVRSVRYLLVYAPLHNRRRVPDAKEWDKCVTIERR